MSLLDRFTPADIREMLAVATDREAEALLAGLRAEQAEVDPAAWVGLRLGDHLWSAQHRVLESVRDHRRTAVPSCHGPGKSFIAGRIAAWFVDAHPPLEAFVVTSAPTDPQVKAILWREITRAHRRGRLPGRVTLDAQWKIGDELVAFGRKPADVAAESESETVTAFQGIHARFVLVIFDEAAGIPKELWTAANSLLTNEDARFLAIGNPDDPGSEFAAVCAGADPEAGGVSERGWNVVPIDLFSTPNFSGEQVPDRLRPYLPSRQWLEDFRRDNGGPACGTCGRTFERHGEVVEHQEASGHDVDTPPLYVSKVWGRFPTDRADGMVPWSWLHACRGEDATKRIGPLRVPVELGVDVGASDNGDLTIVRERQGMRAGRRWSVQSSDPEKVAAVVVQAAREAGASLDDWRSTPRGQPLPAHGATRIKVDVIGVGWALVALLRRDLPGVDVVGVDVREAAEPGPHGEQYVNLRAAIWWEVARGLSKDRAWDLSDVDQRTLADLAAHRWFEDKAGRIVVEEKAQVRKRLGRSPDDADALLLAFYDPPSEVGPLVSQWDDARLLGSR